MKKLSIVLLAASYLFSIVAVSLSLILFYRATDKIGVVHQNLVSVDDYVYGQQQEWEKRIEKIEKDAENILETNDQIKKELILTKTEHAMSGWVSTDRFAVQKMIFFVSGEELSATLDVKSLSNASGLTEEYLKEILHAAKLYYDEYVSFYGAVYDVNMPEWEKIEVEVTLDQYYFATATGDDIQYE